jgi:ribonuclease P protein component
LFSEIVVICIIVARQFTLGRKERLKSRKAIEQLFSTGHSFVMSPFRIFYQDSNEKELACLQFGIGVSSRNFRKAVDRNRIKRLTRESWRLQKNRLRQLLQEKKKGMQVFMIYTGKEMPDYTVMQDKMQFIINKLVKQVHENISPGT